MKKLLCLLVILFIYGLGCAYADWEWWNEDGVEWKISEKAKLGFAAEEKFRNDMRDIYCYNFDISALYEFSKYWDLGIGYKYEREREYICEDTWDDWLDEHRFQFDPLILKWEWKGFKFSDRNRFEYRILQERENRWRYKNRIKIKRPITCCSVEFTPFLSDEIYYDFLKNGFYENRFAVGICKELVSFLELEVYYMAVSCKGDEEWENSANVFGTILVLSF